jgi:hypothetical protein
MLDAAAFGAASYRRDPALPAGPSGADGESGSIALATMGLGLRVVPRRHESTSFRLDVGWSVAGSGSLARRPYVAIAFTPWLLGERHRDGRITP